MKPQDSSHITKAVNDLRIPAIPSWGVLLIDLTLAIAFAVLVSQGVLSFKGITWHIAAILGVAVGELASSVVHLLFTIKWRRRIVQGIPIAYEHFNNYLTDSATPLDRKNVPAAAQMLGELITKRGMNAHMWHASISALLCVPAWLSVLAAATQQGATQSQMGAFLAPMFLVVGLSLITLLVSVAGMFIQQAGVAEWTAEVSGRRITSIARAIDENRQAVDTPAHASSERVKQTVDSHPFGTSVNQESVSSKETYGSSNGNDGDDDASENNDFDKRSTASTTTKSGNKGNFEDEDDDYEGEEQEPPRPAGRRSRDSSRFGE